MNRRENQRTEIKTLIWFISWIIVVVTSWIVVAISPVSIFYKKERKPIFKRKTAEISYHA